MSDAYIIPVSVGDIFADETYQRGCDSARARKMAEAWDRRLAGVVEVSDRGESTSPRYAVIDGQHRWAAASLLTPTPLLVANVHEGLTVADEARLFDKLNRERRVTTGWDHWKARRAAGDELVLRIEKICSAHQLVVDMAAQDGCISCVSTLERVARMGGVDQGCDLLDATLELIAEVWSKRRDSLDAPIIHGIALVLRYLHSDIDIERLADVLLDSTPRRITAEARRLAEETRGTLGTLHALAVMDRYNRSPGRAIRVTAKDFGGGSKNARSSRPAVVGFAEQYTELRDCGFTHEEIAKKMGIQICSLVRQLERYSIPVGPVLASLAVEERSKRATRIA